MCRVILFGLSRSDIVEERLGDKRLVDERLVVSELSFVDHWVVVDPELVYQRLVHEWLIGRRLDVDERLVAALETLAAVLRCPYRGSSSPVFPLEAAVVLRLRA